MGFAGIYQPRNNPIVIRAGELRHAVSIEAPSNTADSFGASVTPASWNTVRTTHAAIYSSGSREVLQASQLTSEVDHVVKVRWTEDAVRAGYRVAFGSRFFTVLAVENVLERNRVLLIRCKEVDA